MTEREKQLHEVDVKIYNFVIEKQTELERPVTMKEICEELNISDRQVRLSVNALRYYYRGVSGHKRIIDHFIGETGKGFKIGMNIVEDERLREVTSNIALKKASNLETKGLGIKEDEKWGREANGR